MRLIVRSEAMTAAFMLGLLATAPLYYLNFMPVFVAALEHELGLSAWQAGFIASANLFAAALSSLAVALMKRSPPWRSTATVATLALVALEILSSFLTGFGALCFMRIVHGLTAGVLAALGMLLIARTSIPDRAFAIMALLQYGLAGAGVIVLPKLVEQWGTSALFITLAGLTATALFAIRSLPDPPEPLSSHSSTTPILARVGRIGALSLLALLLFQVSKMVTISHLFEIGRSLGHSAQFVSVTIGSSYWLSLLGPLALTIVGLRFGRFRPILLVAVIELLDGACLLLSGQLPTVWITACIINAVSGSLVVPLLYGLCAAADTDGKTAILSTFCSKLGLAAGPALGGLLLTNADYKSVLVVTMIGTVLCGAAAAIPARVLDRSVMLRR